MVFLILSIDLGIVQQHWMSIDLLYFVDKHYRRLCLQYSFSKNKINKQ